MRVLRHHLHLSLLLIAAIEGFGFFAAPFAAALIRFEDGIVEAQRQFGPFWRFGLCFVVVAMTAMLATGLYSNRQRAGTMGIGLRLLVAAMATFAVLAVLAYAVPFLFVGRGLLGLSIMVGFAISTGIRFFVLRLVDADIFKLRIVMLGAGRQALLSLSRLRRRTDRRGFVVVACLRACGDADPGEEMHGCRERIMTAPGSLREFCVSHDIDEIVVAMDDRRAAFPSEDLLECRMRGIHVIDLQSFLERETGKLRLDALYPSWLIFGGGFHRGMLRQFSERCFDIVMASLMFMATWPLILLVALAIKIEDGLRAPVFYLQARVGLEGRTFRVIKFRSMHVDAEQAGARWATSADSRVTRVGAFIRKTRLDELPQVINVLVGDMSLVGPRPERPEFVGQLDKAIPFYRERHYVKPGITGWAQLCYPYGASVQDAAEKLQYDLYYVKNRNLLFDLSILIQTVEVVLWRKGAR